MTRNVTCSAFYLAATMAMGAPALAMAAPANTGGAAEPSADAFAYAMQTTCGGVDVAENAGRGAEASGDPLASHEAVSRYAADDRGVDRVGNAAQASDAFAG